MIAKGYAETLAEETMLVGLYGTDAETEAFDVLLEAERNDETLAQIDAMVARVRARATK